MRSSNAYLVPSVVGLVALLVAGLIFRPLLYILLGILAIAGLLFFLIVSAQQTKSSSSKYHPPSASAAAFKPSASSASRGSSLPRQNSPGASQGQPSGSSQASDTQTILLIIALVVGFFIITVAG